ncbi:CoA transferase [Alcaligenaceae bacterium]|nr:CoA transferase [Alcaligenaceae bacterium]
MDKAFFPPFEKIRVLDFSQGLAGPYCAMLFAQWGATVLKVEPQEGDWLRHIGRKYGSHTPLSLAASQGKYSVAVDMKHPEGARAMHRVASQCEIIIESFRPGVMSRLGLGYADVATENPNVVYVSISGFGQAGDYAQLAGSDSIIQAFSGLMSINQDARGVPQRSGMLVVDTLTALYAFQAAVPVLYGVQKGSAGRHLDISLMQATAAFIAPKIIEGSLEEGDSPAVAIPSGVYRTSDGYITLAVTKEIQFKTLCQALRCENLLDDPRYADFESRRLNAEDLCGQLQRKISLFSTDQCLRLLREHKLLASRVNSIQEWLADEKIAHATSLHELGPDTRFRLPDIPGLPQAASSSGRNRWPDIGGDAGEILPSFGFSDSEIAALAEQRVLF